MITINGETFDVDEIILSEFLKAHDYNRGHIAIERNEEIIPKAKYDEAVLRSGDLVEIVRFVGGG